MTVRQPPSYLQGIVEVEEGHTAANDRLTLGALFLPGPDPLSNRPGILPAAAGGMGEVTLLSDVLLRVAPFRAILQGTRNAAQGQYVVVNDADLDRAIEPAAAGVTRLDLVAIVVRDSSYAPDTQNNGDVIVLAGDPVVTDPVAPVLDGVDEGNALVLGTLAVPPPGSPVTFTPAPNRLTVAVGGILPRNVSGVVPAAYDGQWTDGNGERLWRGKADGTWTANHTRYWGYFESPVEADWPTSAMGAQYGDILHSRWHECAFMFGTSSIWRQITTATVGSHSGVLGLYDNVTSRGGLLHNGFRIWDSTNDRQWVSNGGAELWPAGGKPGNWQNVFDTVASGWTVTGTYNNLGNGLARVYVEATKTGTALTVPADGNIGNVTICNISGTWHCEAATPLVSGATGRMCHGMIGSGSRAITLGAVAPGTNIAVGETISLTGLYPLLNPQLLAV